MLAVKLEHGFVASSDAEDEAVLMCNYHTQAC